MEKERKRGRERGEEVESVKREEKCVCGRQVDKLAHRQTNRLSWGQNDL